MSTDTSGIATIPASHGSNNNQRVGQEFTNRAAHVVQKALEPAASPGNTVTATPAALVSFATQDITKLGIQLEVATAALDQLDLYVQYHADGDYINLSVGVDWSSHGYPVTSSNITNDASIAVGTHWIDLDVSAFYSVRIWAASATTSTVDVYAGGING